MITAVYAFLCSTLICLSAMQMESSGDLAAAGAAWQEQGDIHGQVRVMGRLIEEAIYAGHSNRALLLITELEGVSPEAYADVGEFWRARIAWSNGLSAEACRQLEAIDTEDLWLKHRADGLSLLFREKGLEAVDEFLLSIAYGTTARRKFWSALDLCSAYLNIGMYDEALALSAFLTENYTGDALAKVMYGLCLHASGRFGDSFRVLSAAGISESGQGSCSASAVDLAVMLMEGFEQ